MGYRRSSQGRSSLVIWRGPSVYDGGPIMVTLVPTSQNVKTGNMAQVYVLRADKKPFIAMKRGLDFSVCGRCKLSPNDIGGCYVGTSDLAAHWNKVSKQPVASRQEIMDAVGYRPIRLGAYGDMAAVPARLTLGLVALARGRVTNYTHGHLTLGFRRIEHLRPFTMLSVESLDAAAQAWLRGWRTYRILAPGERPSRQEVLCPYQAVKMQCYDCLLCGGRGLGKKSIAIDLHGGDGVEGKALRVIQGG